MASVHTLPIYEGMSIREAWQHVVDAGVGNEVPEFVRDDVLGKRHAWVSVQVSGDELLGAVPWRGPLVCDPDTLDEPWTP